MNQHQLQCRFLVKKKAKGAFRAVVLRCLNVIVLPFEVEGRFADGR